MLKAYQICLEMVLQRNYTIIDKDDERILALKPDGFKMCVFTTNSSKFNVETIHEYISMMKKMDINHSIIVYQDTATPVAKKIIEESTELNIELFHVDELQYNITKHSLVPRHQIMYKKNTVGCSNFKKKYSSKFPLLQKNDPVARFYGFDTGDIIKITRDDGVMFRIVK
jgi:DNA-directed RNA polymerase I, II, and III subunit RPABC1